MTLQQIRNTKLCTNEVADDKLDSGGTLAIEEIVAHVPFPGAESDGIHEARTSNIFGYRFQNPCMGEGAAVDANSVYEAYSRAKDLTSSDSGW